MPVSLSYACLGLAMAFALFRAQRASLAFGAMAFFVGTFAGVLQGPALIGAGLLAGALYTYQNSSSRVWRPLSGAGFLALSLALFAHRWPGFENLRVYDHVRFAEDSLPFTMYLNFDKALVGWCWLLSANAREPRSLSVYPVLFAWLGAVLALTALALASGYVRLDLKAPPGAWLWLLNNLLFVCTAEEALARGFVQGTLRRWLPGQSSAAALAILGGALFFGALHAAGGPAYVFLAAVAGLFYGYAYERSGRLAAGMLVHVGVNAVHFLAFSYPALVR